MDAVSWGAPSGPPWSCPPLWLPPGWHRLLSGLGLMENLGSFLSSASTTTHPLCIKRAHVSPGEGGLGSVGWHSGGGRVCGQSRAGKLQEQLRPPLSRTSSEEPLGWPWVQGLGSSGPGDGHGQPAGSQRYTRGGPSQSGDSALSCPFSVMLTSRACPHCPPSSSVPAWEASWEAGTAQGGQLCCLISPGASVERHPLPSSRESPAGGAAGCPFHPPRESSGPHTPRQGVQRRWKLGRRQLCLWPRGAGHMVQWRSDSHGEGRPPAPGSVTFRWPGER